MKFLELNLDTQFERLANENYEIVVAIDVLEHVFDPFEFVRNCFRILKPGGWLFLRVPNIAYLKHRWEILRGALPVTSSYFETPGLQFRALEGASWMGWRTSPFFYAGILELVADRRGFRRCGLRRCWGTGLWFPATVARTVLRQSGYLGTMPEDNDQCVCSLRSPALSKIGTPH